MRYFLFVLLTAMLVACTAGVSQETPSPVAIIIETAPPTADTPTETVTLPPADTPNPTLTHTPRPTRTPLTPTLTPTPALPFTDGYLLFFWDNETPSEQGSWPYSIVHDPKQDLYMAFPGTTPNNWEFRPLLRQFLDWDPHAPTWPTVALSPDKTKIAFSVRVNDYSNPSGIFAHALYVYDLAQNQLIQLTQDHFLLGSRHSWLPDSENLVYGWGKEIYQINLFDLLPELLVGPFANEIGKMYWSPTDQILAIEFMHSSTALNHSLVFFNNETKTMASIVDNTNEFSSYSNMVWSSDGRWFAFNLIGYGGLVVVNSQSLEVVTLVTPDFLTFPLGWSPDSTQLAYIKHAFAQDGQLFILDISTLVSTLLVDNIPFPDWFPPEGFQISLQSWSFNGDQLIIGSLEDNVARLAIWNRNSQQMTNILEMANIYRFYILGWSPDGEWLLFFATDEDKAGLYVVNAMGGEPYFILDTTGVSDPYEVYWLPCQHKEFCGGNDG